MATAIQIAVAAALVMAWVWVLGRPLVKGLLQLFGGSGPDPTARAQSDEDAFWGEPPRFNWLGWARKPAVVRRRQLLLATVFASFGSFLLAVALRGRFVYLFGLMVAVLALHLGVASFLGGRLVRAREQARRDAGGGRGGATGAASAPRIPRLLAGIDDDGVRGRAGERLARYPLPDLDDGYRSPLAGGEQAVSSLVEELIELEWGPAHPVSEPTADEAETAPDAALASPLADHDPPTKTADPAALIATRPGVTAPVGSADPARGSGGSVGSVGSGEWSERDGSEPLVGEAAGAETEPIFSRPAAQAPVRPRRKARPIYIHSHLDAEGFEPPRAVNHP